jgi:hypothetical protein
MSAVYGHKPPCSKGQAPPKLELALDIRHPRSSHQTMCARFGQKRVFVCTSLAGSAERIRMRTHRTSQCLHMINQGQVDLKTFFWVAATS